MQPLPIQITIPAPIFHDGAIPDGLSYTVAGWCERAGIPFRVTGGPLREARLCASLPRHAWTTTTRGDLVYLVAAAYLPESPDPATESLRVLEVLAHGFHDYGARESLCHKGFVNNSVL